MLLLKFNCKLVTLQEWSWLLLKHRNTSTGKVKKQMRMTMWVVEWPSRGNGADILLDIPTEESHYVVLWIYTSMDTYQGLWVRGQVLNQISLHMSDAHALPLIPIHLLLGSHWGNNKRWTFVHWSYWQDIRVPEFYVDDFMLWESAHSIQQHQKWKKWREECVRPNTKERLRK